MGSIPVAQPSPHRTWHFSRRIVPLALLVLGVIAVVGVTLAVSWPEGTSWEPVAEADALAIDEPVHFVGEGLWLVKLQSGEIIALSEESTHLGCTVAWRADYEFMGRTGWFYDPCSGSTFDITGAVFDPPAPRALDRYDVRIQNGTVLARLGRTVQAPADTDGISYYGLPIPTGP